jgi:release factor glutamine methyltransferase
MTIEGLLRQALIDPMEARILLAHALGYSRVQLVTRSQDELSSQQLNEANALLMRRRQGEPVAYLTGEREFYGLSFEVTPEVLIPRHDTERLVELAIEKLPPGGTMLDLGTGSGAIAVAVAYERRDATISATDASEAALAVARRNAARHRVSVRFSQSDWFMHLTDRADLIACNPPYIPAGDPHLSQGDLRFEPRDALTDEASGMTDIAAIIDGAPAHLHPDGWLLLEHGYDQAPSVRSLLTQAGWSQVQSWRDLAGIERVTGAIRPLI